MARQADNYNPSQAIAEQQAAKRHVNWGRIGRRSVAAAFLIGESLLLANCGPAPTKTQPCPPTPASATLTGEQAQKISTECAGVVVTPDNNEHAVSYENPNFFNDIDKALNMTPKQLAALQINITPTKDGRNFNPEDILAGKDEGGTLNLYRGMIVSATVMDETTAANGRPTTTKKGVIAMLFESNGQPMIAYYVADLSKDSRVGIDVEQYKGPIAFNLKSTSGTTEYTLKTPTQTLIESIGQYRFDPSNPLKPTFDKDGILSLNLKPGEIVNNTTLLKGMNKFLDAVGGPVVQGKTLDLEATYNQIKSQLSSDEVIAPFSFKGATVKDIQAALANAPATNNSKWRITSLRDAITDPATVADTFNPQHVPFKDSPAVPATVNGQKTTLQNDYLLSQRPNAN